MDEFIQYIAIFEVVTNIFDLLIGSGLVFGALKWRKGLLSTVAFYWGLLLGFVGGALLVYMFELNVVIAIIFTLAGGIVFPILTYRIAAVNRFVLGFVVTMKLLYMLTTHLFKKDIMSFGTAIIMPLLVAVVLGVIFALLRQMSVLPFSLACVFMGASLMAPKLAKYMNQFIFGITQDYSLLFDPIDFVFALFKIELTDGWTLLFMLILMAIGFPRHLNYIKKQGYTYDTPVIAFEIDDPSMHGKIIS